MLLWTLGCIGSFGLVFQDSWDIIPAVGLLDQKAVLFLDFWGNSILFSTVAAPVCIPTNSALGFPFLHSLASTCWFVNDGHSDQCEVVSRWGFNLHLSDGSWCWASFQVSLSPLHVKWNILFIKSLSVRVSLSEEIKSQNNS